MKGQPAAPRALFRPSPPPTHRLVEITGYDRSSGTVTATILLGPEAGQTVSGPAWEFIDPPRLGDSTFTHYWKRVAPK